MTCTRDLSGTLLPGKYEIRERIKLRHSFYIPLSITRAIEKYTHTCANCRKTCQPSRASSLFAMDRYSFLSRPRLGMHSWILIVCFFSRHSPLCVRRKMRSLLLLLLLLCLLLCLLFCLRSREEEEENGKATTESRSASSFLVG